MWRITAALVSVVLLVTQAAAQDAPNPPELVRDSNPLHVQIDGKDYALDSLILRRPGTDKLPVALIAHGASAGGPRMLQINSISGWVDNLAQRGWLAVGVMRRGFGKSEGELVENSGTCTAPASSDYLNRQTDDLQAALGAIAKRPDADMSRVLLIGQSTGGATVMALAARLPSRVTAVVNGAGGLANNGGHFQLNTDCSAYESDVVWNFARFGTTAHMPTLWLYAENDGFFRPGLVSRMKSAYTASGGKAELVFLPPFGSDGHTIFFANDGPARLLPHLDQFLRANDLPTWNEADFTGLFSTLTPPDQQALGNYLRSGPTEKALALASDGSLYWHWGASSMAEARDIALGNCQKQAGTSCRIIAQDFVPVADGDAKPTPAASLKEGSAASRGG